MRALLITAALMTPPSLILTLGGAAILSTRRRMQEVAKPWTYGVSINPESCESCTLHEATEYRDMPAVDHYPATTYALCAPCARTADLLSGIETSVGVR